MNNGWVKLHRQALNNDLYKFDHNGWRVFTTLLLIADRNGEYKGGRLQIGALMYMNPNTAWSAILRLEKQGMLERISNNRYSTIRICKWKEYQQVGNNQTTTAQQPDNNQTTTAQHSNKKEEVRKKNKNEE